MVTPALIMPLNSEPAMPSPLAVARIEGSPMTHRATISGNRTSGTPRLNSQIQWRV